VRDIILLHARRGGPTLHPAGRFTATVEGLSDLENGPFDPWLRVTLRTPHGLVTAVVTPHYAPGSDLEHLACWALEVSAEDLPSALHLRTLVGRHVPCVVRHQREHGAQCAVARIPPRSWWQRMLTWL
jgi:hypothetical protein